MLRWEWWYFRKREQLEWEKVENGREHMEKRSGQQIREAGKTAF